MIRPTDCYTFTGDGSCRSCDAPLLWFRTPRGKAMPIDDGKGDMPAVSVGDEFTEEQAKTWILPFCHFSTCPNAAQHRRPRE